MSLVDQDRASVKAEPIKEFVFPPGLSREEILMWIREIAEDADLAWAVVHNWDKIAEAFALHREQDPHPGTHIEGRELARLIKEVAAANGAIKRVVDFGCGGGWSTNFVADNLPYFDEMVGLDISPEMIQQAKAHNNDHRISFIEASASEAISALFKQKDVRPGSVDLIVAYRSLDNVQAIIGALKAIFALLKPGGYFVFAISSFERDAEYATGDPKNKEYLRGAYREIMQGKTFEEAYEIIQFYYDEEIWKLLLEIAGFTGYMSMSAPYATPDDDPEVQLKYGQETGRSGAAFFCVQKPY